MRLGPQELLILLIIVMFIFGGSKIAGIGKSAGRAIREFKDEIREDPPASAERPDVTDLS